MEDIANNFGLPWLKLPLLGVWL